MESLYVNQVQFGKRGSLHPSVSEAQKALDLLENARQSLEADSANPTITLARLQGPIKQSFDAINSNLKEVHKAATTYSKSLDKTLKAKPATSTEHTQLSSDALLDRAIGMHLLREGQFGVATTFLDEIPGDLQCGVDGDHEFGSRPTALKAKFEEMYYILQEMRSSHNLTPAMQWADTYSKALQDRGSDLEFELMKLQFTWQFARPLTPPIPYSERVMGAMMYARQAFGRFEGRYLREIQQLLGALAFSANLSESPYKQVFEDSGAWDEVALSFTREFCSLLGLSADSPLFIATTAGAMALPRLDKLHNIMKNKRTEWTTAHELPVEIPLPPAYRFHSIFVCPVSKEQTTDSNPPMLLPCCHVIAQESLTKISKLGKYKCPYCPTESQYNLARKVLL